MKRLQTQQLKLATTNPETPQNVLCCSSACINTKLLFRILLEPLFGNNCQLDVFPLFDDGSSITMLDKEIAEKFGVRGTTTYLNAQSFRGSSAQMKATAFNIHFRGANKNKRHLHRNVYDVSNVKLPPPSCKLHKI